jgi:Holliday junction resolvase RusA-like endonuclease
MHRSTEYSSWCKHAEWASVTQIKGQKITGKYTLEIVAVRPDKRRRDLGNLEKAVSDLLQKIKVIQDDYLCEDIRLRWAKSGPECLIIVREYTDEDGSKS